MWKKNMSAQDVAELIERFLEGRSLYPQEWNDFVDTPQGNQDIEIYRMRCYQLDPEVNRPGAPDANAIAELRSIMAKLRLSAKP